MADLPDLTSPRELMVLLKRSGLQPQRGLGQNFLIDGNIARKIVNAALLEPGEPVIEIGPGAGALTSILARRSVRVVALELDRGLAAMLADLLSPFPEIAVLHENALMVDWAALIRRYFGPAAAVKLISNLPYNISGPLLYAFFKQGFPFKRAVLMLQKEVAERLTAAPGGANYGALSVICRYYTGTDILFPVSKHVFWPRPKVDSAVASLEPRSRELGAGEEALFWKIVQGSFQQRRKTLANSLGSALSRPREEIASLLRLAGVDPLARAESLSTAKFAKIAQIAYNCPNYIR